MRARDNPFRTERLERIAFRDGGPGLEGIRSRWIALGRRGAIVGPHGSGKTTLLRALGAGAAREGFRVHRWFRNAESPPPAPLALVRQARGLGPDDVLVVDGAGHLPGWAWRLVERLARSAGGLLVTAHAPGLLPTLVETRTDRALLAALLAELTGEERPRWEPLALSLFDRCGGNLRDVFLTLYDVAAQGGRGEAPRLAPAAVGPRREAQARLR